MHKMILKMFEFLKSFIHFLKILILFCLLLHLLLWIQSLTGETWSWMNFSRPILKSFLALAALFSDKSTDLFGTVFEYKYAIAVFMYFALYYICDIFMKITEILEDKYDDARRAFKKYSENFYNKTLKVEQTSQEKNINKYKIYVSAGLNRKFLHPELGYCLADELIKMNKFLTEKTYVTPLPFEKGFLYSYDNFDKIDSILDIFFKLIKSNSCLDYIICIQTAESTDYLCTSKIKQLLDLKYENKIIMFSDTAYRYKFNTAQKYGTSPLGLFQKGSDTLEVHEFVEI